MNYIYRAAENTVKKHGTRNPFELLQSMGVMVRFSYDYDPNGLKGFSTIQNRIMFVVINGNLSEDEKRIVAGHEAAHLILHKAEILSSPAKTHKDFTIYDNSGRLEYEANTFLSDFLLTDKDVADMICENNDFFACAVELCVPPQLLSFKLAGMMNRGFDVDLPIPLHSGFMRDDMKKCGNMNLVKKY